MTNTLYVSRCPLNGSCHWTSEPFGAESTAHEALRTHLNGHTHGALVAFAMTRVTIERFQKEGATG